ncbi:putative O-methyltransferase [Aspergillus japonicus CBS 114.51]|uniref:Putative O-methyltransferase n=1 Tax=Aspergillus japonicus CBS 114.51 TaxID=1448312 RepID=A0A8T8WWV0_ASPJA|nr:putative O-methyltransferase [Aspergillus japonicus CBS 114.51]RAH80345.1 putative O-methyltransferase [Aspergillus japonicus CBS 114.51]
MPSRPTSDANFADLGRSIASNLDRITQIYTDLQRPLPSYEIDSPLDFPVEVQQLRQQVLDATLQLQQLLLGPKESLFLWARNNLGTIRAVSEFDLARSFPVGETATFAEIATTCGLPEQKVRRIIRHAATEGIFREEPQGVVRHTAASRMLAEDQVMRDYIDVHYTEMLPAMKETPTALRRWPNATDPAQTGFSLSQPPAHPTFFQYLTSQPDRARVFASAMSTYSTGPENDVSHLRDGYDWSSICDGGGSSSSSSEGVVVDVGGSTGYVSLALAQAFPGLRFVVQDTAPTIAQAPVATPPGEHSRVQFMAHDFFTDQPVHGADVYLLRMVLHDFGDADCVRILRGLVPALRDGGRVVLNEFCLPEPGSVGLLEEKQIRTMDMNMLSLFNSRERDAADWQALFAQADPRFRWGGVTKPAGSNLSVIQASWWHHSSSATAE